MADMCVQVYACMAQASSINKSELSEVYACIVICNNVSGTIIFVNNYKHGRYNAQLVRTHPLGTSKLYKPYLAPKIQQMLHLL
jgi:hypothetical protein